MKTTKIFVTELQNISTFVNINLKNIFSLIFIICVCVLWIFLDFSFRNTAPWLLLVDSAVRPLMEA